MIIFDLYNKIIRTYFEDNNKTISNDLKYVMFIVPIYKSILFLYYFNVFAIYSLIHRVIQRNLLYIH